MFYFLLLSELEYFIPLNNVYNYVKFEKLFDFYFYKVSWMQRVFNARPRLF